jgi:hypothetical protein
MQVREFISKYIVYGNDSYDDIKMLENTKLKSALEVSTLCLNASMTNFDLEDLCVIYIIYIYDLTVS